MTLGWCRVTALFSVRLTNNLYSLNVRETLGVVHHLDDHLEEQSHELSNFEELYTKKRRLLCKVKPSPVSKNTPVA